MAVAHRCSSPEGRALGSVVGVCIADEGGLVVAPSVWPLLAMDGGAVAATYQEWGVWQFKDEREREICKVSKVRNMVILSGSLLVAVRHRGFI